MHVHVCERVPEYMCVFVRECVSVCVCVYLQEFTCASAAQRTSDSLELKLQVVVTSVMWVLGVEPMFSARTVSALCHRAIFPVFESFLPLPSSSLMI